MNDSLSGIHNPNTAVSVSKTKSEKRWMLTTKPSFRTAFWNQATSSEEPRESCISPTMTIVITRPRFLRTCRRLLPWWFKRAMPPIVASLRFNGRSNRTNAFPPIHFIRPFRTLRYRWPWHGQSMLRRCRRCHLVALPTLFHPKATHLLRGGLKRTPKNNISAIE